ncbi:MAG TPA: 5-formyltetrahydrofolate cyclo-ligase [Candidatus Omnitrophota bacterium]|nr:5-formyltetrahydrofolate cyclo-ligase [Candidatus Omnitrophota bacterium]
MKDKTKQDLRERILTLLRNQKEEERIKKSLSIKDKLFKTKLIQEAKTILFYASFDGEVDTFEMIRQASQLGKRIGLPIIQSKQKQIIPALWDVHESLVEGPYGIRQPQNHPTKRFSMEELDAVIVPGVAFDRNNHRLGRGGGYYDRFLAVLPKEIPTIGLAFDFQCIDSIPGLGDHDVRLSRVVTN